MRGWIMKSPLLFKHCPETSDEGHAGKLMNICLYSV